MKRKSKQRWSTIPPISTKQTIICHLNSLNTKRGNTRYVNILQSTPCICVHCIGHSVPIVQHWHGKFYNYKTRKIDVLLLLEVDWQEKITNNINYLPSIIFCDGNCSHIWVLTSKTSSSMSIDSSSEWNIKSKYNIAKTCMYIYC